MLIVKIDNNTVLNGWKIGSGALNMAHTSACVFGRNNARYSNCLSAPIYHPCLSKTRKMRYKNQEGRDKIIHICMW